MVTKFLKRCLIERIFFAESNVLVKDCAAIVQNDGKILLNKNYQLNASEWEYVIFLSVLRIYGSCRRASDEYYLNTWRRSPLPSI